MFFNCLILLMVASFAYSQEIMLQSDTKK